MKQKPKKIAVLGGGLSAITTIFHLMQEPDWKEKYDITVYQLGWRIGGKGASGVNTEQNDRIEEHGLHLWMGFYENAFLMMEKIYTQLNRAKDTPLATLEDAFKHHGSFIFAENINDKWIDWKIDFPTLPGKPGDGLMPNHKEFWQRWVSFLLKHIRLYYESTSPDSNLKGHWQFASRIWDNVQKPPEEKTHPIEKMLFSWLKGTFNGVEKILVDAVLYVGEEFINTLLASLEAQGESSSPAQAEKKQTLLFKALKQLRQWAWEVLEPHILSNDLARRLWIILDLSTTLMKGLLKDKIIVVEAGKMLFHFDQVNEEDYCEWLRRHGANEELTIKSPLVRSMYDGPFSFVKGNPEHPNIEAGTILRIFLRLAFTCKQSVVWKMQGGMGDVIFAPAYELMVREGVKFNFFQNVRNLKLSADKSTIESIEIGKQVTLTKPYEPLIDVKGLACWPAKPRYDFIAEHEADELKRKDIDLESHWRNWEDRSLVTLQVGVDFDTVLVGFSLASLPHICPELIEANPKWQAMLENMETVQTQAYQLWFNQNAETLGGDAQKIVSAYVEPIDTFATMNHILPLESWTEEQNVQYLAYLCGALDEPQPIPSATQTRFPEDEKKRVEQNLQAYIQKNLPHLLSGAFNKETGEFKERYLVSSYARANISPSERYVLSVKGSSKHRIRTDETGFSNLYITGDWIQNGFNAGFVEGAVVAGIWTARKISGKDDIHIIGEEWNC